MALYADPTKLGVKGIPGIRLTNNKPNTTTPVVQQEDKPKRPNALQMYYRNALSDVEYDTTLPAQTDYTVGDLKAMGISDFGESQYDKEVGLMSDLENLGDFRANAQSGFMKLTNGLAKMGVLALTTAADTVFGSIAGIINGFDYLVNEDDVTFGGWWNSTINNPVSVYLNSVNESAEGWFPNYYTEEEQNRPWYENLGTANFWGDHFLKNTGFFIGAAIGGKVNAGLLTKVTGLKKVRDVYKGVVTTSNGESLRTFGDIYKAYQSGDAMIDGVKFTEDLAKAAKSLRNKERFVKIGATIAAAAGEGRMEAITGGNDFYNKELQNLKNITERRISNIERDMYLENPNWFNNLSLPNGEIKQDVQSPILTQEGLDEKNRRLLAIANEYDAAQKKLEKQKIEFQNADYLWNLVLLTGSDLYQFGKSFVGGYSNARQTLNLIRGSARNRTISKGAVMAQYGKAALGPVIEGTEEMFQQGAIIGLSGHYGKKLNDYYGASVDPEAYDQQTSLVGAILQGLGDTYSSGEEWENFFLGALTSLIPMGMSRVQVQTGQDENGNPITTNKLQIKSGFWGELREARELKNEQTALAKTLNETEKSDKLMALTRSMVRSARFENDANFFLENGDKKGYKDTEAAQFINQLLTYDEIGRYAEFRELLEQAFTITDNDINGENGLRSIVDKETGKSIYEGKTDDEIRELYQSQKDKATKMADNYVKTLRSLETLYSNSLSKEGLNQLAFLTLSLQNREDRIKDLTDKLSDTLSKHSEKLKNQYNVDVPFILNTIKDLSVIFNEDGYLEQVDSKIHDAIDAKIPSSLRRNYGLHIEQINNISEAIEKARAEGRPTRMLERRLESQMKSARNILSQLQATKDAMEKDASLDYKEMSQDISDLMRLLVERETMLNTYKAFSSDPSLITDTIAKSFRDAISEYINRQDNKLYDKFSQDPTLTNAKNLSQEQIAKLKDIANSKEEKSILKTLEEADKILTLAYNVSNIYNSEKSSIIKSPAATRINNLLMNIIDAADSEENAITNIKDALEELLEPGASELLGLDDISDEEFLPIVRQFKSAFYEINNIKNGKPKKEGKKSKFEQADDDSDDEDTDDSDATPLDDMNSSEMIEYLENNGTKDEFIEWLKERRNGEEVDLEAEAEDDLRTLIEMFEEQSNESDDDESEGEESSQEDDSDDDAVYGDEQSFEEAMPEPKKKSVKPEESKEEEPEEENPSTPATESLADTEIVGSKFDSLSESKQSLTTEDESEDAFNIGRRGCEFEIEPLKDPSRREAIKRNDWITGILHSANSYEFLNTGELARLKEWCEKNNIPLRLTYVKHRSKFGGKERNIQSANTLFLAVELPDGYKADKKFFAGTYYVNDINNPTRKMQLLGVVRPANNKESKANYAELNNAVQQETSRIKTKDGKIQKMTASKINTNLEWIFSGRIVKFNEAFPQTKEGKSAPQRNLKDVLKDGEENDIQICVITETNPDGLSIKGGARLTGRVIPINENTNKTRFGTIFIRTKEADGRIYPKSVQIKKFDKNYKDMESPIIKQIRSILGNIIDTYNSNPNDRAAIAAAVGQLSNYIYFPDGKKPFFNPKTGDFKISGSTNKIKLLGFFGTKNSSIDKMLSYIQEKGFKFSIGNGRLNVKQIIDSNILTTDLAQLHNANASFLVSETVKDGDDWKNVPSQLAAEINIHTGTQGYQASRDVKYINFNGVSYGKDANGTYFIIHPDGSREELSPADKSIFFVDWMYDINIGATKNNVRIDTKLFIPVKGKRIKVYSRTNTSDGITYYMTASGHVLSEDEISDMNTMMKKQTGKLAAQRRLQNAILKEESGTELEEDNEADDNAPIDYDLQKEFEEDIAAAKEPEEPEKPESENGEREPAEPVEVKDDNKPVVDAARKEADRKLANKILMSNVPAIIKRLIDDYNSCHNDLGSVERIERSFPLNELSLLLNGLDDEIRNQLDDMKTSEIVDFIYDKLDCYPF